MDVFDWLKRVYNSGFELLSNIVGKVVESLDVVEEPVFETKHSSLKPISDPLEIVYMNGLAQSLRQELGIILGDSNIVLTYSNDLGDISIVESINPGLKALGKEAIISFLSTEIQCTEVYETEGGCYSGLDGVSLGRGMLVLYHDESFFNLVKLFTDNPMGYKVYFQKWNGVDELIPGERECFESLIKETCH